MDSTTALIYVYALELRDFLPAWIAHAIIATKGVETFRWIGTSKEKNEFLVIIRESDFLLEK